MEKCLDLGGFTAESLGAAAMTSRFKAMVAGKFMAVKKVLIHRARTLGISRIGGIEC